MSWQNSLTFPWHVATLKQVNLLDYGFFTHGYGFLSGGIPAGLATAVLWRNIYTAHKKGTYPYPQMATEAILGAGDREKLKNWVEGTLVAT